jgi:hypothetical protein
MELSSRMSGRTATTDSDASIAKQLVGGNHNDQLAVLSYGAVGRRRPYRRDPPEVAVVEASQVVVEDPAPVIHAALAAELAQFHQIEPGQVQAEGPAMDAFVIAQPTESFDLSPPHACRRRALESTSMITRQ